MTTKFSERAQAFLKSLSHQPWGTNGQGQIRVLIPKEVAKRQDLLDSNEDQVCPLCMWGNITELRWKYTVDYWNVMDKVGLASVEISDIVRAADNPSYPYRAHLEQLLGMTK
jgi:hypothetical protein